MQLTESASGDFIALPLLKSQPSPGQFSDAIKEENIAGSFIRDDAKLVHIGANMRWDRNTENFHGVHTQCHVMSKLRCKRGDL